MGEQAVHHRPHARPIVVGAVQQRPRPQWNGVGDGPAAEVRRGWRGVAFGRGEHGCLEPIGTHLNIDEQTAVRVFVGMASVEFHCANTEVEMYEAELARFIETAQDVLPHLRSAAMALNHISAGVVAVAVDVAVTARRYRAPG